MTALTRGQKKSPMEKYFCTVWIIFLKTTRKNCCLFIVTLRKLAFLLGNLCLHVEPKSTLFIACLAPAMYYISHGCYVCGVAWFLEKCLFWIMWVQLLSFKLELCKHWNKLSCVQKGKTKASRTIKNSMFWNPKLKT